MGRIRRIDEVDVEQSLVDCVAFRCHLGLQVSSYRTLSSRQEFFILRRHRSIYAGDKVAVLDTGWFGRSQNGALG